ncbi:winged helix-turn-helix domain-containing protein [Kribbella qitaiheensis]|uniref:winged helix-turn-helix domain-containing protein n=1 Tax=Kribbella qitaiheensis TaxID=1544730 RepID=UPI0036086410
MVGAHRRPVRRRGRRGPDFGERNPRHAFEKLAAELRAAIEAGQYPVGSELPYARDLAATRDVSVGTVSRAIAELRTRGLVEAMQYRRARVTGQSRSVG